MARVIPKIAISTPQTSITRMFSQSPAATAGSADQARAGSKNVSWVQHAAPLRVRARDHRVAAQVHEVPDAVAEPAGREHVPGGLGGDGQADQGEATEEDQAPGLDEQLGCGRDRGTARSAATAVARARIATVGLTQLWS